MPSYPFVLCPNGDIIARVNTDGSWSVRWDRVLDVAYDKPNPRQMGVIAFAKMLLAARDNFIVAPWSNEGTDWKHYQAEINYLDHDPLPDAWWATISYNGTLIARVNHDGSWSIQWDEVGDLSRWKSDEYHAVALVALCRLFMAAKDRFRASPWDEPEDDE